MRSRARSCIVWPDVALHTGLLCPGELRQPGNTCCCPPDCLVAVAAAGAVGGLLLLAAAAVAVVAARRRAQRRRMEAGAAVERSVEGVGWVARSSQGAVPVPVPVPVHGMAWQLLSGWASRVFSHARGVGISPVGMLVHGLTSTNACVQVPSDGGPGFASIQGRRWKL